MRDHTYISALRKTRQKVVLFINGTLLCILFIPFCMLFAAIYIMISLADQFLVKLEKRDRI